MIQKPYWRGIHWIGILSLAIWLDPGAMVVRAEDPSQPTFGSMIGGLKPSGDHLYIAESHLELPVYQREPLTLSFRYRETTPFLRENAQAQLLYSRYDVEADFELCDFVRLITIGGYHRTQFEDRPGSLSAYALGAGFGSPLRTERSKFEWSLVGGGYLSKSRLESDWWADAHAEWRFWEWAERKFIETPYRPSLSLAADIESSNEGAAFHALYKVGPVADFLTANGNRMRYQARWYHTDGNPFYNDRDTGLLLGIEVVTSLNKDTVFNAREQRPTGLLPLVWGQYEVGYGVERTVQRIELDTEVHDLMLGEHRVTAVLHYESHQEQRSGDFDNVGYYVSPGLQTSIGLASPLSQGDPLVLGCDYVHRSGHSLNPDSSRVPAGTYLQRDSVNLLPRLRLQTLGWDLPYRDAAMYQRRTDWLNFINWRATVGYDVHSSRERSNPAAQLGLSWDVATIQGYVIYVRGLGSIGNEIPDWEAELGVRRPAGKLFIRTERYGLERHIARGNAVIGGIGFNL